MKSDILKIHEHRELIDAASKWFNEKWHIPQQAYYDSMQKSLGAGCVVPRWYVVIDCGRIIAGLGVIENDFHDRNDLAPNVCAVYVEPEYRGRGMAGSLLDYVCSDMKNEGISELYLITDHTSFYERYGWEYYCRVNCIDRDKKTRMYIHRA